MLYFDNLSPDTADAYLTDGLTEEIATRLGSLPRLQVKSLNAVRRYRGAIMPELTRVGRGLRVRYLVEGSVRRAGPRVRVLVRLVKAEDGFRVWGAEYDRMTTDLLALQIEIARQVATGIAGQLAPAEHASLADRPTQHPEAYEHFLRGNYDLARRTPRAVYRAIQAYDTAARLDPGFSRALARAAYGYALFLEWGWEYPSLAPESLLALGFAAADRALRQDSAASDAWLACGYLLTFRNARTFDGVRAAFERAVALDSVNAETHHQYGSVLVKLGEDSAAAAAWDRALALEPERPVTLLEFAELRHHQRRFEDARRLADSALRVDPGWPVAYGFRSLILGMLHEMAAARADAQTAVKLGHRLDGEMALALLEARAGDTIAARARVEHLVRDTPAWEQRQGTRLIALGLLAAGQTETALDVLERFRPRGPFLWYLIQLPEFDPIRSHPRFQRLVEESRPR